MYYKKLTIIVLLLLYVLYIVNRINRNKLSNALGMFIGRTPHNNKCIMDKDGFIECS